MNNFNLFIFANGDRGLGPIPNPHFNKLSKLLKINYFKL